MSTATYWVTGINPEPWAVGTPYRKGSKGMGISPNGKLVAYQEALADEFTQQNAHGKAWTGDLKIKFLFWRSSAHGNVADATNLQKATEDALQGVLYSNDRANREVGSVIMAQAPEVSPHILIIVQRFDPDEYRNIVLPETHEVPKWAGSDWVEPEEELF
jgi:Holliday junction resolvase RusA-like endonuclease